MIKNNEHYQITGDLNADFGQTITNPIIKIGVSAKGAEKDGLLKCEYNVYLTAAMYEAGKYFFKAEKSYEVVKEVEGEEVTTTEWERLINFTYPVQDSPFYAFALGLTTTPPTENALQAQTKILADTFGWPVENVVLVIEND